MNEVDMKRFLNAWFQEKNRVPYSKEIQMPVMKYGNKTNKPDVFVYKKRVNVIYLIECKRATRLRYIGHAFGQILATKLALIKTPKNDIKEKFSKITGKTDFENLRISFGVAFPSEQVESSKSIRRMINMFHRLQEFREIAVYLVSDDKIKRMHKGRNILYSQMR